ncbi:MAG: hypothetical protein HY562_08725 [Ignavibacteriales bacterium]|nr:hypothetical protein [Ignavibacteriales bacterium]
MQNITKRLERTRSRTLSAELHYGLFLIATFLFGGVTLIALAEASFDFTSSVRTGLFFTAVLGVAILSTWFAARPLLKIFRVLPAYNDFELARKVGEFFPQIRDRLLNLLQLEREMARGSSAYSAELVDASFQDLAAGVQGLDFAASVDTTDASKWRKLNLFVAMASLLCLVTFPTALGSSLYRLLHFDREFVPPAEYTFEVSPGNKEVVKGDNVTVRVRVRSVSHPLQIVKELSLFHKIEGQENFDQVKLRVDTSGSFQTLLTNVRASTMYFAQVEDVQSEWYELKAVDRPILRSFRLRLDFPSYTQLPPRMQEEFIGDVTALAGTKISVSGSASKDLREAAIVLRDGRKKEVAVSGEKFTSTFTLETETSYFLHMKDDEGLANLNPVNYQLRIIPDESPTISIVEPGRNLDIAGSQSLNLLVHARDDFGFSQLRLGYRLVHSRYERPSTDYKLVPIRLPSDAGAEVEVPYTWDLSRLDLVPEDVVEYFAEVFDNDVVRGPKSARSAVFLIRLPSLEEVFTDVNKGHEQSLDELNQALETAKELKENIESINQDLKKNKDFDWQKQKKLEEMAKKYQEVQKKLEDVKSRVDQMIQKMDQQGVLSQETMEKYFELQQLFEQLNSEEMQKIAKQMQQAMQNVNKDQLRQALQRMTFSEERFRQSIERTINLLKRIQVEQKLEEVKKRTEELAKEQKELLEESAKSEAHPQRQNELAKQQEDLARKEVSMEEAAEDLQQRMEEFFSEMPAEKLQKMNEQMKKQKLGQQMSQAAQHMRQGRQQQAASLQQQAQQQLQEFGEQLDALQQEMLQQNAQYVMNEMRRAISNLLELSKREEELKQQSQNAPPNSPQLRQNAQDQMRLMQDLGNVIQGLSEVSQRSFAITPEMGQSIGEALSRMQNAMRNLDIRSGSAASAEQNAAMAALNKAAIQLQGALQSMMQGGQGGGMGSLLNQLQAMAGQQMSINQQTLSLQQAADAARLAQEQDAVRKSLDQLNKEAEASGEQKKLLGDLERIAQDMKEVVRNLEQNNVNPETIQKQERILSRLLDASKSMRERDFEKRRKAETGTQVARRSPADLDFDTLEGKSRLREDLLKALEQGYARDYRELIRKYFEELEKTQKIDR